MFLRSLRRRTTTFLPFCCAKTKHPPLLLLVCDGLYRTLAGSCVCLGTLPSYRQALAVTHATVATDFNESFDIQSNFTAKVAFYCDVLVDIVTQLCNVFFGQILDADIRIDTGTCQNLICCAAADSVPASLYYVLYFESESVMLI